MKPKFYFLMFISFFSFQNNMNAQLFVEHFNYPIGDTLGAHGWISHSGASAPMYIVSDNLQYSNYPNGTGNSVYVSNTGEDYSVQFTPTPIASDSIYISLLVKVDSAKNGGDYFFHTLKTGSGTFLNRIYVKKTTTGNLCFGLLKGTTTTNIVWSDSIYSTNTTHLLLMKVKINPGTNNDVPSLFINPSITSSEPLPTLVATDISSADYLDIDRVALRQGTTSTSPKLVVDGIRVAKSWVQTLFEVNAVADLAVSKIILPVNTPCGAISDTLKMMVKNLSGNTVVNTPVKAIVTFPNNSTQTLNSVVPFLAVGDSILISFSSFNSTLPGQYHVKAWSEYAYDTYLANDTLDNYIFTVDSLLSTPFIDDFETINSYWELANFNYAAANSHGNSSSVLFCNINNSTPNASAVLKRRVAPIEFHSHLLFNYRILDEITNVGVDLQPGDSLIVEASTDCMQTFFPVSVITSANHITSTQFARKITRLSSYIGQNPVFRVRASRSMGNYIMDLDSLEIRNADPSNMAVLGKNTPISKSCGLLHDSIKGVYKNVGDAPVQNIPVSVMISRPYTPPFVTYYDTIHSVILPGEQIVFTFDSTINTTVSGKYTMMVKANLPADTILSLGHVANNTYIDSVFTYSSLSTPYLENFTSTTYLNDYVSSFSYDALGFLTQEINGSITDANVDLIHKVGPINSTHSLFFQYKYTDLTGNAQTMGSGDSLTVLISSDCGNSYSYLYSINNGNHIATNAWITKQLPLSSYTGQSILVSFRLNGTSTNRGFSLDNIMVDSSPSITLSPDTLMKCSGQTAILNPVGSSTYQYEWIEINNPSVVLGTNQTLSVTTNGFYKVKATNGVGITAFDSIYVSFRALPVVNLVFSDAISSQCPNGSAIALSGHSPLGGTFSGTGVNASQFNPQIAGVGSHLITYTFADAYCANFAVDTIIVTPPTLASLTSIPDFCLNDPFYHFTEGIPDNGVYTADCMISGMFYPSNCSVGNHIITYTVTDAYNCQFKAYDTITIKPLPNVFAGNNTSICLGDSVTLIASGSGSYLWSTGATSNSIRVSPTVESSYIVKITGSNGCANRDTVSVAVKPIPVVEFGDLDTVCLQQASIVLYGGSATPQGGVGVYSGAGVSNNSFNPMVGLGPHTIRYTYNLNGCSAYAESVMFVRNCTGIEENDKVEPFSIYPNPAIDQLSVRFHAKTENTSVQFIDVIGKVIKSIPVDSLDIDKNLDIDLAFLSPGVYIVRLSSPQKSSSIKLIKR